jgi:tetratricopeptide (TPR) repeat protein
MTLGTAYLQEAHCEVALGDFYKAAEACVKADDDPDIHHRIALAQLCLERHEEAEDGFQRALARSYGTRPEIHVDLSALYLTMGRWEDAVTAVDYALADSSYEERGTALTIRGRACSKLGRLDDALEAYETALKSWPELCLAQHGLGEVHEARDQAELAAQRYSAAVQCDDQALEYRFDLGRVAASLGDLDTARASLEVVAAQAAEGSELGQQARDLLGSLQEQQQEREPGQE